MNASVTNGSPRRSGSLLVLLSGLLLVTSGPAWAGIVKFEGVVGINGAGQPALPGPGVKETDWFNKLSVPLAAGNVICPDTSLTISQTKTSKVSWNLQAGAKGGVNWGVVQAELSTSFGVEVGKEESITIEKTVPASKYISKKVTIFSLYQRRRYTVLGRTFDVFVPIGFHQRHKDADPKCPCPYTAAAAESLNDYALAMGPGPLQEQALFTASQLNGVLDLFNTADAEQLLIQATQGLNESMHSLDQLALMGADPGLVEQIGQDLTRDVMDHIVDDLIHEATNLITNDPATLPLNPHVEPAVLLLEEARQTVESPFLGPARFGQAADQYAAAFGEAFDARAFSFSDNTVPDVGEFVDTLPELIMGDANGDGVVDDDDLSLLLAHWNQDVTGEDDGGWGFGEFNGLAPVQDDDLSLLLANWSGPVTEIPEPASALVMLLGFAGAALRRGRK